ncbi:hypothetical protein [Dinghuibacter silviterrae]|uniref:Putative membrane protein n=1 Tax=Dinghuibacter silviterrae TaxID=1539049 RepID=A0A4R8DIF6_9BACT|nr:hypothetical protein [Dinghuibacter silviterrae]TDW96946.1 putative membrane protein [Dinghuibacter silviterrae]
MLRNVVAILCYCTFVGWVIAYGLHRRAKTPLGAFHLRQTFLLYVLSLSLSLADGMIEWNPVYRPALSPVLVLWGTALFVLWLVGLIGALNGAARSIPLIGKKAQEVFPGITA